MPLTPLPQDNTKRYKLLYTVAGINHSMTSRCSSAQTDGNAVLHFQACLAALINTLGTNVTWVGIEVALQGSNVFNIISGWTPTAGTGGAVSLVDRPRAICYPGRTSNGRKSKVFVYGTGSTYVTPDTYEEDPLVTAPFQGFQGLLNSQADFWLGIDGVKPTWYFRNTIKTNDHYVDSVR